MTDFEYIVVGNGMFGSAATRYLSEESPAVAVIGPGEPPDERTHDGVYASHYDERRLARLVGRSKVRSELGRIAMGRYRMLEDESGIEFYEPVGCLIVNSSAVADNNLESTRELVKTLNIHHTLYEEGDQSWREQFSEFDFPDTHWVIHEPDPAGMVDPRAMLRAQNVIAERRGATLIDDIVVNIEDSGDHVTVETRSGERYLAGRVLVTVGSFTNCFKLFPNPLPLQSETETIVLGRVSSTEADRLTGMPTISYFVDDPVIRDVYMAPPVRYSDGNFYIKMGANTPSDLFPNTLAEIQAWFHNGDSDAHIDAFERVLRKMLPNVEFLSFHTKRCIITRTPNKYPTIDRVTDRTFVASGAHGSGVKSADIFGQMAAGLTIDGRWPDDVPRDLFRVKQ